MASVTAPGLSEAPGPPPAPMIPTVGAREVGEVQWFCAKRGFGWLRADDGTDVFMSFRDLPGTGFRCVEAGATVCFTRGHDDHGPVARAVVEAVPTRPRTRSPA